MEASVSAAAAASVSASDGGGGSGSGSAAVGGSGGLEGENKKPPEGGEVKSKRKMKTASQLQLLETTYATDTYPSEELRAQLSAKLGLTDRQLQMWFCHRRLKDRKGTPTKSTPPKKQQEEKSSSALPMPAGEGMGVVGPVEVRNEIVMPMQHASGTSSIPFTHHGRVVTRTPGVAVARISTDMSAVKRYYEPPQQSMAELRAVAFVEAQLGEKLREDGPILGMEYDPLPPDAFGTPIGQQKQSIRPSDANLYEPSNVKTIKGPTRSVHEYQFLPQQPTVKSDAYERVTTSYHYGSPVDIHNTKTPASSTARSFIQANELLSSGYGFPSQLPSLNLMTQEGRQSHHLPPAAAEYEPVLRKSSAANISMDPHPITALENPFIPSDGRVVPDDEALRIERKRKSEEARIAREVEAHEKRIRKEIERQDILRRKREEQIRKEVERQDRERRKEEERLLREKQREEERLHREQRRELERRERFLQKESIRAEKMRQKEELRREKEAARQKAATERAIARRIAKESLELVDDERLELMELAASSKGLPSIVSLDFETLQNLDSFRDKLAAFPPKSVPLKKPFAIQPWNDSEENVGNLLMVWRFLITFMDVLGMWPFTLDEFIQAFHDFDPRLLSEIHVALLRTIIKDIEDVARTPASVLGANQNAAANPGCGHPQIVEGAYAWGFDIRSWQCHLNPLTWPEILRQLALSAGFGPKLKKRNTEQSYLRDENEGNDGEDVITNLRNGSAVENAVAIMQERGFSNPRRSRHRLTPGTVKYAAFHVLSVEGAKGLTIPEVAEKIQKSGLRDLTTSKTPEASISAALSRDTKLFERTAPSTYCVRAAYRKDPADSEATLWAARERIQIFKSGVMDGEDADDAERDEDSESDVADDPDAEDLSTDLNPKIEVHNSGKDGAKSLFDNGHEESDAIKTPQNQVQTVGGILSLVHSKINDELKDMAVSTDQSLNVAGLPIDIKEKAYIDESNLGETWVQGLMEGEYSDLSVEERLNALVALIGVAIEGNSIRIVLEERLEAANALKKQMWAEAQLDKRRMKEEYVTKVHYSSFTASNLTSETRQSPIVTVNEKVNEISLNSTAQQEQSTNPQNNMNYLNNMSSEGNFQMQDLNAGPDNFFYMQPGLVADKSRSQLKSFISHKAEEMYVYRSLPLGQDRRRNRYWLFTTSNSRNDPGCSRIFVELRDGRWRLVESEKGFDSLLASLDVRGVREAHLHMMLQKIEMLFKEAVRRKMLSPDMAGQGGETILLESVEMVSGTNSPCSTVSTVDTDVSETSTSFNVELGKNETEIKRAVRRYQDFEKWMWKECSGSVVLSAMKYAEKRNKRLLGLCDNCNEIYFLDDVQCPCHQTRGSDLNIPKHLIHYEEKQMIGPHYQWQESSSPLRIKLLKMQLALTEAALFPEALQPIWSGHQKLWGKKLLSSFSAEALLQSLTLLEGFIKRDYVSLNFETTDELLSLHPSGSSTAEYSPTDDAPMLPWLPRTTAAVALRVMELDSAVSDAVQQKMESQKGNADYNKLPSKVRLVKNSQDNEATETPHKAGLFQENNWADTGTGSSGLTHGQGSRARGRRNTSGTKLQARVSGSRSESGKRSIATNNSRTEQVLSWKGQSRTRGGSKRGHRSGRSRQTPVKKATDIPARTTIAREAIYEKVSTDLQRDDWDIDEMRFQLSETENLSSSERSNYDNENGQVIGDEYDDLVTDSYAGGFNGKSNDSLAGSDYNLDLNEYEEDDDDDVDVNEDDQGDMYVEEYRDGDSDYNGMRDGDEELNEDADEVSSSSDFGD